MRTGVLLVGALFVGALGLWFGGCSKLELDGCSGDDACGEEAVCEEGFCISDPLPRLILVADRSAVRAGETVRIDGSSSFVRGGGAASLTFEASPGDAVVIIPDPAEPRIATVRFRRPHEDVRIIAWAESERGRRVSGEIALTYLNSPPLLSVDEIPAIQPGERVELRAEAVDPDGDPVTLEWTLDSDVGELEFDGEQVFLLTDFGGEDERYRVTVKASDDRGGVTTASLVVDAMNRAPKIQAHPAVHVDHHCFGEPLVCDATATLEPTVVDVGPLRYSWRLLEGANAAVEATFDPPEGSAPTLTLHCDPACKIAGDYLVEFTVSDHWGERATATVQIVVGNRPPQVLAHDGEPLPHRRVSGGVGSATYEIWREDGTFLSYFDPDGDPIEPGSLSFSSSSELLEIGEVNGVAAPSLSAIGRPDELLNIELTVSAADWYGAGVVDTVVLQVDNRAPVVEFGEMSYPGHLYDHFFVDPEPYYNYRFVEATDPDGDPLTLDARLDPADVEGLRLAPVVEWALPSHIQLWGSRDIVGYEFSVLVTARDEWGGETTETMLFPFLNHLPTVAWAGPSYFVGEPAKNQIIEWSCCGVDGPVCSFAGVWRDRGDEYWGVYQIDLKLKIEDLDRDPVFLEVYPIEEERISARLLAADASWRPLPATIECPVSFIGSVPCDVSLVLPSIHKSGDEVCEYHNETDLLSRGKYGIVVRDSLGAESERLEATVRFNIP